MIVGGVVSTTTTQSWNPHTIHQKQQLHLSVTIIQTTMAETTNTRPKPEDRISLILHDMNGHVDMTLCFANSSASFPFLPFPTPNQQTSSAFSASSTRVVPVVDGAESVFLPWPHSHRDWRCFPLLKHRVRMHCHFEMRLVGVVWPAGMLVGGTAGDTVDEGLGMDEGEKQTLVGVQGSKRWGHRNQHPDDQRRLVAGGAQACTTLCRSSVFFCFFEFQQCQCQGQGQPKSEVKL